MCAHYLGGGEPPRPPETHLDGDLMGPWLLGSQPECRPLLMVSRRRHIPSSENWSRHAGSCLSSFHSERWVWYESRVCLVSPSLTPALITTSLASKPQLSMWSIQINPSSFSDWPNTGVDRGRQDRVSDFKWVALAKSENFQQISILLNSFPQKK